MTVTDRDWLRKKYAEERAKQLQPDGPDQYDDLADRLPHTTTDPYR